MRFNIPNFSLIKSNTISDLKKHVNELASATSVALQSFNADLASAKLIKATLSPGQNKITHSLNRKPKLWFIADINAAATIYRVDWDTETITLNSSAQCEVLLCLS